MIRNFNSHMLKGVLCFALVTVFGACGKTKELVSRGYYFIDNHSSTDIRIEATLNGASVRLERDTLLSTTKELIYVAVEATGGHVLPSNFFTTFKVYSITGNQDSLIYEGVNNSDWIRNGGNDGGFLLTLTIN